MTTVAERANDGVSLAELAEALRQVRRGEFDVRLPRRGGPAGEAVDAFNSVVSLLERRNRELLCIARVIRREGRMDERMDSGAYEGAWAEGIRAVNGLIDDLARPTQEIARVIAAVAEGDLSQHMSLEIDGRPLRGEFRVIGRTVNTMVDQLSSFADEVTRVAREVGTEGKLGGQAEVRGVAGTWRQLTENVNQLASTLTTQLRAIAQVSTAVTRGDLTQQITVEAQGEVAELKDNINQMIVTLRETTRENAEQSWLDSNIARIGGLLQGQRDLDEVYAMIVNEVAPLVGAQLGAFFAADTSQQPLRLRLAASYGYVARGRELSFEAGEGIVGQVAVTRRTIRVPAERAGPDTPRIRSGLVDTPPADIVVLPVLFEGELLGVIEFASVSVFSELHLAFLDRLVATIGVALNTILANRRTEELLAQSQRLTAELRERSRELERTNAELEQQAALLSEQNRKIEIKNREIERARTGLEEKAQQLARASQYKSEFLANISHELRTPLNSLLLLARLLAENQEHNLTDRQIEFARTIYGAGSDLLALIDDILDLSKIEAGRMDVEPAEVRLADIREYVEQAFAPQAEEKGLDFSVELAPDLPDSVVTDEQRLQQILRNLLSNAVKFTDRGSVSLRIGRARHLPDTEPALARARQVIAFTVADTGIGIPQDKVDLIFEQFHQADGTTSRKYGGTGLGLSISRKLSRLLGGAIGVTSTVGVGSEFTLYLPDTLTVEPVAPPAVPPVPGLAARRRTSGWAEPTGAAAGPSGMVETVRPERRQTDAAQRLEGAHVLIVDDDVRNVFALASALELHGMRVLYADNGADGVRLLAEHPEVDIVLMDAMMPEMDGHETTRAIRRNERFATLPVVFLTAKAMPGDRESALAAGASDYITKPVDLDDLLELMAAWVSGARRTAGL
jgi:signal transduction histidine kinase/ActR/RegA family two-component response regulator